MRNKFETKNFWYPITFLIAFVIFTTVNEVDRTKSEIEKCNNSDGHTRDICYQKLIEQELEKEGNITKVYLKLVPHTSSLNENLADISFYGNNCHVFNHALGVILAKLYKNNITAGISFCTNDCFGGCTVAFIDHIAYLHDYDEEIINKTIDYCSSKYKICISGAGHIYFDKYFINLNYAHDLLTNNGSSFSKYIFGTTGNLSLAFEVCEKFVEKDSIFFCHNSIAHRIYSFIDLTGHNWTAGIELCNQLGKYKQFCLERFMLAIGRFEAVRYIFKEDIKTAIDICKNQLSREPIGIKCFEGIGLSLARTASSLMVDPLFTTSKNNVVIADKLRYLASICQKLGEYSKECNIGARNNDIDNLLKSYIID